MKQRKMKWAGNIYTVAKSPHAGAAKIQKPQETQLRNSSGALPRLASPPFPSLRSALCVARLHGNYWIAQQ
jgi:hypothetical protein